MANAGRFRDLTPNLKPAGIQNVASQDEIKITLSEPIDRVSTPTAVRHFNATAIADVGVRRPQQSDIGPEVHSKVMGKPSGLGMSINAQDTLKSNTTPLQEVLQQQQALRGKRQLQSDADPDAMYGKTVAKADSVADCMRSTTTEKKFEGYSSLRAPRDYGPGVQTQRDYSSTFKPEDIFGTPTPNDTRGVGVASAMSWSTAADRTGGTRIVDTRAAKFTQPQERVDPATTPAYGKIQPNHIPMDEIINAERRQRTRLLRQADVARQVRLKLQCSGFQSYRALKDAFIAADADCDGELSREELRQLFEQQRVWLEDDQVEAAFAVCDGDHDGKVKYEDLLRVLDWRQPLPDEEDINEVARRMEVTDEQRVFGLPSIRTDRPPPRRKAVDDMTNYGDLTTTKTLVTPDAFTLSGVDPSEMDRPRSMKEAVRLLQALDQTLSEDLIRQVYQQLEDKSITTSVIQLSKALALSQTM